LTIKLEARASSPAALSLIRRVEMQPGSRGGPFCGQCRSARRHAS
jgi:hypothetical protein